MGTLHEDQYTFLVASHPVLPRMGSVSGKSYRENQHILCSIIFFNHAIYEILWKNIVERDMPRIML
jgi:hypothetical protein